MNAAGRSVQRQGTLTPDLQERKPVAGRDVITSIDLPTQLVAEQGLIGRRGSVVAIDPNNGDVIALVSTPGFDPNPFGRGLTRAEYAALRDNIDVPLLNRAIRGEYPPGSTVKPAIALGGLALRRDHAAAHEGLPRRLLSAGRQPSLPRRRRAGTAWSRWRTAIAQVLRRVLLRSLLEDGRRHALRAGSAHFGFGQPTGIDIGGERKGILPSPEWKKQRFKNPADQVWFPGETVNFGIGQGYLVVTPLQLAHMASILATRGKTYQPRLVKAFREQGTGKIEPHSAKLRGSDRRASPEKWKVAVNGMSRS